MVAGSPVRSRNSKSLAASDLGTGLALPISTCRFDRSNGLTCEFFFKATLDDIQEGAWAVLLGLHNSSPSRFPVCFQENGQGLLNLRADTDQTNAGAITSRRSPFDGDWHHVACTLQPTSDGRATVSSFYLDGELQGALEKPGAMPEMADAYMEIGTRAKSMLIDEIRISNGVLDVADFLHPRAPAGLGILVR